MCTFMQVQVQVQAQAQVRIAAKYHGLAAAHYDTYHAGVAGPTKSNRNLRRGLQLETPRLALQQNLGLW